MVVGLMTVGMAYFGEFYPIGGIGDTVPGIVALRYRLAGPSFPALR